MLIGVLDTETTGLSSFKNEILEFAIIVYEYHKGYSVKKVAEYSCKIKPLHLNKVKHKRALEVNHYSDEKWANAKHFNFHQDEIKRIIEGCDFLMGHNLSFDLNQLYYQYLKYGESPPDFPSYYDTYEDCKSLVARGILKSAALDAVCEKFKISFKGETHTAYVDCERTVNLWITLKKMGYFEGTIHNFSL